MREIKVYKFDELDEESQKKAIENMRSDIGDRLCEFNDDDYRKTLEEIEKVFAIKVRNWCVGYPGTYYQFEFTGDRWDDIADEPKYLPRYLNSEVLPYTEKGKYFYAHDRWDNGKFHYVHKNSKVLFDKQHSCCLTGCWCDNGVDDALDNMNDAIRKGWTIRDFIDDMLYRFFKFWERDDDYAYCDDAVKEEIISNDFEFFSSGQLYA